MAFRRDFQWTNGENWNAGNAVELAKLLFVKAQVWSYEQEIGLLVDLNRTTRLQRTDDSSFPIHVFEVPTEAIDEVYVGFDTPTEQIGRIQQIVAVGEGGWRLKYTHWHAYRMQVTSTLISNRKQPSPPTRREKSLTLDRRRISDGRTGRSHGRACGVTR